VELGHGLPLALRLSLKSFPYDLQGQSVTGILLKSFKWEFDSFHRAQHIYLGQLLNHSQNALSFRLKNPNHLFDEHCLLITLEHMLQCPLVLITGRPQMIQWLLRPHQDTLGEDGARVLVRILDQLVSGLFRLQSIDYDLSFGFFQRRGGLHVLLGQVLVKLGVKLLFSLL